MQAIFLKTEHMTNPLGIDIRKPYLSWQCRGGIKQTAYEIQAFTGGQVIWNSGKVASSRMNDLLGVETASRQRVSWQVRLWDQEDVPGEWSEEAFLKWGFWKKTSLQQNGSTRS